MLVREPVAADLEALVSLRSRLWPEGTAAEHRDELRAILAGRPPTTLPLVLFVAELDGAVAGFVEVGLRSYAEGCDESRLCACIEGWYVDAPARRRGLGRALIDQAVAWARQQGCRDLASDAELDNEASQAAHLALGFAEVERSVHYHKTLAQGAGVASPHYGRELARVHHEHFGMVARAAATELRARLVAAGRRAGTIVELAAGTGISSRALGDAGYAVHGVDLSEDMLRLARVEAPQAHFETDSLWSAALPSCVALTAVGEAFSYAQDPRAGLAALGERLAAIERALVPGGLLLFDVAGPGRSGQDGLRRGFFTAGAVQLGLEEREERSAARLTRDLTLFVPMGQLHRRVHETHVLRLYAPEDVERLLEQAGFEWERLGAYADFVFPAGWHAYLARKP